MADDLNRQFDELIRKLRELGASTREIDSMRASFNSAAGDVEQGRVELERMRREVTALEAQAASATIPFSDLTQILAANAAELQSTGQFIAKVGRSFEVVKNIGRDLLNDSMGITDLSRSQLESKVETLKIQRQSLRLASQEAAAELRALEAAIARRGEATQAQDNQLRQLQAIIDYNADEDTGLAGIIEKTEKRLDLESSISKNMGVTGALVEGTGAFMERLGMRSGIFNDAMKDSASTMREMAKDAGRNVTFMNKLNIAAAGFSKLASGFANALGDPALIIGAITKGFSDLNKAGVEFGQTTGMAADAMSGVHTEVSTAVDMLKTATSVTKELGLNAAAVFTPQQIGQIADMTTLLGLSEQAAGRLGLMMKTTGQSADQLGESVYETVSGLNAAGRSAVAPRQVLDDVLTASEDITLSLGNNPTQLAKAATAARKFGMTLSQVDKIADSLLDFESSIKAELEAQLLTGRDINMAKARELALNNDLAGLAKELEKQGVSAVEFSKMRRIEQEATAKALGMSRQELAKSLLTQEAQKNMTDEQLAAARGVSLEESKRISIQERIEKAIQKVQLAFAPVLEALVPIVENALALINPFITVAGMLGKALAALVKFPPVLYTIQGIMAVIAGYKIAAFASTAIQNAQRFAGVIQEVNKMKLAGIKLDGRTSLAKQAKNMTMGQTAAGYAYIAMQKVKTATVTGYNKVLKLLGFTKLKDVAATTASTTAENLNTAAKAKGNILERISIALGKTRLGQLALEKAAVIGSAMAKLFGAKATAALNTQSKIAATTGAAGGAGMAAFAAGLAALGPVIPVIIGLAAALYLAAPALEATGKMVVGLATVIGNVLMKALEMLPSIIDSVAAGFTLILSQLTLEKAAALVVMGAGFAAIGYGLTVLSASLFTALPGLVMLGALAALGPGLSLAGQGVKLIADNVSKLSEALQTLNLENLDRLEEFMTKSAFTMPVIAAAGPAAASAISTIAGAGGAGEEDNKVAAKIQELIDLVASGQIVELKLDSDTITKQQVLSMHKG